ncbi:hypothetical protein J0895_06860 [Phormidium pseudopriestleyi FRX01]|uniref:Uncharacterized protein n=1 Tax=Phormidium pseudopriestleyi FRX01 TaxID=1759528 RepID=A0ABS3FP51_9CYAN|nr:hypothetical protein [Phormidium pseudopriestleyi]MBO0348823.1 hypothetical protein [Phormidium pseudopriestleyi FRX01]
MLDSSSSISGGDRLGFSGTMILPLLIFIATDGPRPGDRSWMSHHPTPGSGVRSLAIGPTLLNCNCFTHDFKPANL